MDRQTDTSQNYFVSVFLIDSYALFSDRFFCGRHCIDKQNTNILNKICNQHLHSLNSLAFEF